MIKIKQSKTADTRTCDFTKVSREQLFESSLQHIEDVKKGMDFLAKLMKIRGQNHDWTKRDAEYFNSFYEDFKTGFKETTWWEEHQEKERHHLKDEKYIPEDVNLIDILEMIVDGIMAGLARSGEYRKEEIPDSLLRKAFDNTIELLKSIVEVV